MTGVSFGFSGAGRQLRRGVAAALVAGLTVSLAAVPSAAQAPGGGPRASNTFVVRNVRIFDGTRVTGIGSVLVIHGRIAKVGRFATPPRIPVHDGRGKTLLPGLIDGHAHSLFPENAKGDRNDALRLGVTTELEMWGDPRAIAEARRQRRSLHRTDTADVWSAGTGVTVPGGLSADLPGLPDYPSLESDADPDKFVADRIREGSDHIKMLIDDGDILLGQRVPTLTPGQIRAIVAAAHRRGRLAVAHVTEIEHAKNAVAANTDGLIHTFVDTVADRAFVREIRRRGTFVTPTLTVFDCGQGSEDVLNDPRVSPYLSAAQIAALKLRWPNCPPSWYQVATQNVRKLHAAGVPITVGTDAGAIFFAHGASLLGELVHLVRSGLTPAQALNSATATPARLYRLGDRGRITPGFRADLLLVNGNPAKDITAVRDIATIWKNGYQIDRKAPESP